MAAKILGISQAQVEEMRAAFSKIDVNRDGSISRVELDVLLDAIGYRCSPKGRDRDIEIIMTSADRDGNGSISENEFFDFLDHGTDKVWGPDDYNFGLLKGWIASIHEGDIGMLEIIDEAGPPFFLFLLSAIQLAIFIYYYVDECTGETQLGCPDSHGSVLGYRPCCRDEFWRFLSYSLAHAGWDHILTNLILQLGFGVYLEIINGAGRIAKLYVMGVLAGSFASSICDPATNLVGASGACYALAGAWVGFVSINWDTMTSVKYKMAAFLFLFCAADLANSIYKYSQAEPGMGTSYTGHLGGFLMGVTFGSYILKNARVSQAEVWLGVFGISLAITGIIFGIVYNIYNDPDRTRSCPALDYRCHYPGDGW